MRRTRSRYLLPLGLALLAGAGAVHAVSVRSWSASTQDEFARGTLDGTSIDGEGRVRLAPSLVTLWGPDQGVVWSVQPDSAPDAAFVALSGPGRVLRVAAGQPAEIWFEAVGETLVTAMARDPSGGVWFGLSPDGKVMRASRDGGAVVVSEVATTDALFVWTVTRQRDGSLWIGTGVPGRVLRLEPGAEPKLLFDAGDDPVRSAAALPDGGVVFGTGGRGRVVRVRPDGRAFVLYDADETEIVSLAAAADGTIFAVATESPKQPAARTRSATATEGGVQVVTVTAPPPGEEETPGEEEQIAPAPTPRPQAFQTRPGGSLYRLDPDGTVRKLWQTDREMPFAVVVATSDSLLVGTGDGGRVHALDTDGRASRLLRIPSDQVSAMAIDDAGRVVLGGTTDARVESLGPGPRGEGSYLTPAVDAESTADWGRLLWEADAPRGSRLDVEVRSGNTAEPDDTWSDWTAASTSGAAGEARTEVPAARWFQARFRFRAGRDESPTLRRVEVSYQPRNRPPHVSHLAIEPPGVVWLRGPTQSAYRMGPVVADDPIARRIADSITAGRRGVPVDGAIRKTYEAGARTIYWSAEDPDGDELTYSLAIRRDGENDWFPMTRELTDDFHSWDARAVPDGIYRVRLSVDDSTDNPNGTHRRAERISDAFRVDNTPPTVGSPETTRERQRLEVRFEAFDRGGSVAALEVALDGGDWAPLSPLDGVADSERERYEFEIADPGGPVTMTVRVTDSAGNLGGAMWRLD
ncbi:MAG TPA: hypothetical protein VD788_08220 [Candidatus Polarisedimenticolaceae bacterium]|nr:hypothetical protein [Candidatus Polarisedimenticolaceae bacterium]